MPRTRLPELTSSYRQAQGRLDDVDAVDSEPAVYGPPCHNKQTVTPAEEYRGEDCPQPGDKQTHSSQRAAYTDIYKQQEQSFLSKCCNCIANLFTAVLLAVALYMLWDRMGRPSGQDALDFVKNFNVSDFSNVLDNITETVWDNGFNEDPYVGDNTTNIWKGATSGGLSLVLQNALDDDWQTEFYDAVTDWQESDVLELTTIQVEVDNTCARVEGLMKVCNGNFGDTGWLGINEIELEYSAGSSVGYIISSVAKMNEYYLNHADYEQRQYTMCHEIGHGFGLPHTDENFNNQDQGNCLDYTNNPENNLHPGQVNMNRLKQIYGWTEDDDYRYDDMYADDALDDDDGAAGDDAMDDAYGMDDAVEANYAYAGGDSDGRQSNYNGGGYNNQRQDNYNGGTQQYYQNNDYNGGQQNYNNNNWWQNNNNRYYGGGGRNLRGDGRRNPRRRIILIRRLPIPPSL